MKQCLHITFVLKVPKGFLQATVAHRARELSIEGTAHLVGATEPTITVIACGQKDDLQDLIDTLHKEAANKSIDRIQIEPFIKSKDYRGVFRIIE
ncbi:acylphosphatase [Candidatus Dependentiae bacterium]|nr:acylphosphatase [Candidatus Dependentiae bacterium]